MWRNQYVYLSPSNLAPRALPPLEGGVLDPTPLDVEKWVGRVRFGSSQSGLRVKTGQSGCGSIELRVESSRVYPYFSNKFFFFNYKNKSMTTYLERMNKIN